MTRERADLERQEKKLVSLSPNVTLNNLVFSFIFKSFKVFPLISIMTAKSENQLAWSWGSIIIM